MKKKRSRNEDEDYEEEGARRLNAGFKAPPPPKAVLQLVDAFESAYEPVNSESLATEVFTLGRIREFFQVYILPKMPDPLGTYLEELECRGYRMKATYDGSPALLVRQRTSRLVAIEEEYTEYESSLPEERAGESSVGDVIRSMIADDVPKL